MDNKQKSGCLKWILAVIGFLVILSPLNPFIEFYHEGEEEYLTNSSWLILSAMTIIYWVIVLKYMSEK